MGSAARRAKVAALGSQPHRYLDVGLLTLAFQSMERTRDEAGRNPGTSTASYGVLDTLMLILPIRHAIRPSQTGAPCPRTECKPILHARTVPRMILLQIRGRRQLVAIPAPNLIEKRNSDRLDGYGLTAEATQTFRSLFILGVVWQRAPYVNKLLILPFIKTTVVSDFEPQHCIPRTYGRSRRR